MSDKEEPKIIEGGRVYDIRGSVAFANTFNVQQCRRFYTIENHKQGYIRAWHGHKIERKFMLVVRGTFLLAAVKVDNFDNPSQDQIPHKIVCSATQPRIYYIPPGYANGTMNLSQDGILMVFSDQGMDVAASDDYRYDSRHWDIWEIPEY